MPDYILIAIAWPYANAEIHVGNITGSHLPGDIVARYYRLKGDRVLMVSGADAHGTPITLRADQENISPEEVYKRYQAGFLRLFSDLGIQYDLFTATHTENHFKVAQTMFLALKENGYLFTRTSRQWYSPQSQKFLPDRYVEGTCYICGAEGARSDQCDACGNVLDPEKLLNPRSKIDGSTPVLRETEHFYLDLSKLEPRVADFLRARQHYWRETVIGESLRKIESEGLKPRAITRDLDWGIPVPIEGWDDKRLYVWFEAVIGYLSAAIEWAQINGHTQAWENWWTNPQAKAFYFIGKDNIFFHTAMWPAELMGAGASFMRLFTGQEGKELTLPHNVPANQFMNLEGRKISGSRHWAVWGQDAVERYGPDPLRYYLTINMPETRDADWDWSEFVQRNNGELVGTWGNLANRVLSFAYKHWEGHVPQPGALRPQDEALLEHIEAGFQTIGEMIENVQLRAALQEALSLAAEVNKYLDQTAPWFEIKEDKTQAAKSIYTALRAIDSLKTLFAPFLPFSSQKLHTFFGYETPLFGQAWTESVSDSLGRHEVLRLNPRTDPRWQPSDLQPGAPIQKPRPLFRKLDASVVEEERARLGQ